ncbi:MAG: hypothetical protein LH472_08275 [Pyrinomonadaceae bacterium]|nr:hypothetical protein [Pyrinomonadaceae bacterium]
MKNMLHKIITGKDAKWSALLAVGLLIFVGLGCFGSGRSSSSAPVPATYFGDWKGSDGSTLAIRGDCKGDYKSGGTTVDGGTVAIDDAKKELSITFFGIGPTMKIDSPPTGDEMKLGGVIYKRNGGNSTTDTKKSVTDTTVKESPSPKTANKTYEKADASRGEIPEGDELQEMVQITLVEFNDAVQADDFTDFFQTISKLWQRQSSPAKLKDTFQVFVNGKLDIGEVRTMGAEFTSKPRVDDSKGFKELVLEGQYETSPNPTKFELKYTPEGKNWKLTGIMVDNTR